VQAGWRSACGLDKVSGISSKEGDAGGSGGKIANPRQPPERRFHGTKNGLTNESPIQGGPTPGGNGEKERALWEPT